MTPGDLGRLAADELARAQDLHSPMASAHEGYAVLLEELDELWEEVRKKHPDKQRMREEALQVAAMALRFVHDVTDPPVGAVRVGPARCRTCRDELVTEVPATGDGQCIDCWQRELEAAGARS